MKFAIVTDLHYSTKDCELKERTCRLTVSKIRKIREELKKYDFVVNLGDTINGCGDVDTDYNSFYEISLEFEDLHTFFILGNHDCFALDKKKHLGFEGDMGCAFSISDHEPKLIFLDACFYPDEKPYNSQNTDWKESFVPKKQLLWLKEELDNCNNAIIFIHQNLDTRKWEKDDRFDVDPHCVKNACDVRKIIEESKKVKYVFQGHYHEEKVNYINGICYYTVPAMCEYDDIKYMTVTVDDDCKITTKMNISKL